MELNRQETDDHVVKPAGQEGRKAAGQEFTAGKPEGWNSKGCRAALPALIPTFQASSLEFLPFCLLPSCLATLS
jgi:hypothetical protein